MPHTHTCPVCTSSNVELFFTMNEIPVFCNVLHATREEAVGAARGDMNLGYCCDCGHIYNDAFNPKLMEYTQTYENSLHFSPRFQAFAEGLAQDLIERYNLRGKDIIEIGCGKGDFLKLICDAGENRGYGFDASYQPELMAGTNHERFTVIQDWYSDKYSNYNADFVCCRHVLEHIQFPRPFVQSVRIAIGNRPNAVVYFEVPNALWTLQDLGIWDLIYEHCSYFTPNSLARIFALNGFGVKRLSELYSRQFLGIEFSPLSDSNAASFNDDIEPAMLGSLVQQFAESYEAKVDIWRNNFTALEAGGKKAVVWGGGSKGVTFLNVMKRFATVEYMVDINPRKQGMFVAGAGQRVVGPEFLSEYKPDAIIIMNPIYKDEIRGIVSQMGLTTELMVA
jgi:2-polyprenyl-3-methyl-5-hydroxy-6-metoxy-1,4-benzoquinol methylase